MFGLGIGEILIILAFALIFIGPKKLPELAKTLGKGLREFQKAKDDLIHNMNDQSEHHSNNNSAQQFNHDDHIEAEVTGVSEEDPEHYDHHEHHDHDDHINHDDYHDDLLHNEEVDEHDKEVASQNNANDQSKKS